MLLKLSINAVINPLSALHSCKNGELLQHMKDIENVINEIYTPLTLMGLNLTKNEMSDAILKVIHNTHNNYSSMQQDFSNNRKLLRSFLYTIKSYEITNNVNLSRTQFIEMIKSMNMWSGKLLIDSLEEVVLVEKINKRLNYVVSNFK